MRFFGAPLRTPVRGEPARLGQAVTAAVATRRASLGLINPASGTIAAKSPAGSKRKGRCFVRSSSIWVPLFVAGAGAVAVTALVVTQRHSRFSARTEGPLSDPASHSRTDESSAEAVLAEVRNEFPTLDFDPDPYPETARGLGEPLPPSVPERGEAYDAVNADDLGAEWLTRATESLPANRAARSGGEFDELTTLDILDEEPVSFPVVEIETESSTGAIGLVESEAVLADRNARALEASLEPPRPPPHVFDIAELLNEDAPSDSRRRG